MRFLNIFRLHLTASPPFCWAVHFPWPLGLNPDCSNIRNRGEIAIRLCQNRSVYTYINMCVKTLYLILDDFEHHAFPCNWNKPYSSIMISNVPHPPQNGPLHFKIASYSELLDLSSTDLLSVLATFDIYALVHANFIEYHHVGGVCTSQAAWEGWYNTRWNTKGNSSFLARLRMEAVAPGAASLWANRCSSAHPSLAVNRSRTILQGQSAVNMNLSGARAPCVDDGYWVDLPNEHIIVLDMNLGLPFLLARDS